MAETKPEKKTPEQEKIAELEGQVAHARGQIQTLAAEVRAQPKNTAEAMDIVAILHAAQAASAVRVELRGPSRTEPSTSYNNAQDKRFNGWTVSIVYPGGEQTDSALRDLLDEEEAIARRAHAARVAS